MYSVKMRKVCKLVPHFPARWRGLRTFVLMAVTRSRIMAHGCQLNVIEESKIGNGDLKYCLGMKDNIAVL